MKVDVRPLARQYFGLHAPAGNVGDREHGLQVGGQPCQDGVEIGALEEACAGIVFLEHVDEGASENLAGSLTETEHALERGQFPVDGGVGRLLLLTVSDIGEDAVRGDRLGPPSRGSDPRVEGGGGRCAAHDASHASGGQLQRVGDAGGRSLLDIPGGENLIRELTSLVPVFIANEAFLKSGLKLIAERSPDMPALEAMRRANDRDGEGVDAPPQVGESVLAKVVFHLAAFGFLASLFPLESCSLDHAIDELRHVTRGRRGAEGAKRAFQIGGQAKSDFRWCVC